MFFFSHLIPPLPLYWDIFSPLFRLIVNRPDVKSDGFLSSLSKSVKKPLYDGLTDESTQSSDYNSNVKVRFNTQELEKSLSSSNHLTSSVKSDERKQQNTLESKSYHTSQVDKQNVLHPYHWSDSSSSFDASSSQVKNVSTHNGQGMMNVPLVIMITCIFCIGLLLLISRVNRVSHLISSSSWWPMTHSLYGWRWRREKTTSQEELSCIELAASVSTSASVPSGDFTCSHSNKAFTGNESEIESEDDERRQKRTYDNGKRRR